MIRRPSIPAGLPVWLYLPAALGITLIVLPPIALLAQTPWATFLDQVGSESSRQALVLSLQTAAVSTVLCVLLGV
ncbi:molybdate ABC transporter permease subunit, partial [Streptomyces sp. SID10244]|nr:molybdate ABC transporter permease subunit [Streptomyces sp. SID10244]